MHAIYLYRNNIKQITNLKKYKTLYYQTFRDLLDVAISKQSQFQHDLF